VGRSFRSPSGRPSVLTYFLVSSNMLVHSPFTLGFTA
jgi:hypothetical protein